MFSFDNCYIGFLNMHHRIDRLKSIQKQLQLIGVTNAEKTRGMHPTEFDLADPKLRVMKNRTPGAIGCHYGQVEIMQKALAADKDAVVFEDDCIFCQDFRDRIRVVEQFINDYEPDFDIFWLGGTVHLNEPYWHTGGKNKDLPDTKLTMDAEPTEHPGIVRTYGAFCTYAYIVNKNSIAKVLNMLEEVVHLSMGIDWAMIKIQPELKTFMLLPGMVRQMDNKSDIGKGMTIFSGFANLGDHWFKERIV